MSVVRAFTTRRNKGSMTISLPKVANIGRAASQREGRPVHRSQISSPVQLLSSTNYLSYEAPDIHGTSPIPHHAPSSSSSSSSVSEMDSDVSTPNESMMSGYNSTDASSVDESPLEAAPNHLSIYFKPNVETSSPSVSRSTSVSRQSLDAPGIPQRAASHSKKAHERLSRKRSLQRMMSPPRTSREMNSSPDLFSAAQFSSHNAEAPRENPFGKELAQLDEVAEEFGQVVSDVEAGADIDFLENRGLARLAANDYTSEIETLLSDYLHDGPAVAWL